MEQNTLRKQRELTDRLNRYRNEYYNYNNPSVSDEVYDRLFDELQHERQLLCSAGGAGLSKPK